MNESKEEQIIDLLFPYERDEDVLLDYIDPELVTYGVADIAAPNAIPSDNPLAETIREYISGDEEYGWSDFGQVVSKIDHERYPEIADLLIETLSLEDNVSILEALSRTETNIETKVELNPVYWDAVGVNDEDYPEVDEEAYEEELAEGDEEPEDEVGEEDKPNYKRLRDLLTGKEVSEDWESSDEGDIGPNNIVDLANYKEPREVKSEEEKDWYESVMRGSNPTLKQIIDITPPGAVLWVDALKNIREFSRVLTEKLIPLVYI
jgi:hypothetical protein